MEPSHKNVIVTGASSGIGRALALALAASGHGVIATGRDQQRLDDLVRDAGDKLHTVTADASSWEDNQRVVATAVERLGSVDAVVANAGYTTPGTVRTADPDGWAPMVLTNVLGPVLLVRAALEELERTSGRVVVVGSVAGHKNSPGNLYSATKWATTGLAENLRMELASSGIGVTLVSPGVVDTGFYPDGPPLATVLTGNHVADVIRWCLDQPEGVDVNTVVVRPTGQSF